jgi:hypothetical protein
MNDFQDTVPLTKSAVIKNLTFNSALYGFDFPLVYETLTVQLAQQAITAIQNCAVGYSED